MRHLYPEIGHEADSEYFDSHRAERVSQDEAWWRDEREGKHIHGQASSAPDLALTDDPVMLADQLADPGAQLRLRAPKKLQTVANSDAIPMLVLALNDPDPEVASVAQLTLAHLEPAVAAALSEAPFAANPAAAPEPWLRWYSRRLRAPA